MSNEASTHQETDAQAALLPLLYDSAVTAGWTEGMARIVMSVLDTLPIPAKPDVLEVGCGGGTVVRTLRKHLAKATVVGLDLNPLALSVAAAHESGTPELMRGNLLTLPFADGSFDLLLALDSFDQVGISLTDALQEGKRVLRRDGILLLRVSAYPWLLGAHDVAFNTGRRYDRDEVELAMATVGLRVLRTTHANTLLAPPVIAMRMVQKWLSHSVDESGASNADKEADGKGGIYASSLANQAVGAALAAEAQLIKYADAPYGLSLIVAAQKA